MKHRLIPLFLAGALALGTSACGPAQTRPTPAASPAPEASAAPTPTPTSAPEGLEKAELLVGLLYPGDVSDQGYTRSLSAGADEMAQALGLEEGQIRERYNVGTEEDAAQAAQALADAGCRIVFSTSPFFGEEVIQAAQDNPEVQFCQLAGGIWEETGSTPENFHRYYPAVHEGRYLAGIAAGEKAKELGNPRLGYVAPEACAEVISGFTAFYLGAKSVYPEVVMDVVYTGAWEDAAQDSQAAKTLVNRGCGVLGQHTDSTGAATMAEQLGAFYVGFGSDQSGHAPAVHGPVGTGVEVGGIRYLSLVQKTHDVGFLLMHGALLRSAPAPAGGVCSNISHSPGEIKPVLPRRDAQSSREMEEFDCVL